MTIPLRIHQPEQPLRRAPRKGQVFLRDAAPGRDRHNVLSRMHWPLLAALYEVPDGLTDQELSLRIGYNYVTSCKRRGELVKLGYVEDSNTVRRNVVGKKVTVWRITADGVNKHRELRGVRS